MSDEHEPQDEHDPSADEARTPPQTARSSPPKGDEEKETAEVSEEQSLFDSIAAETEDLRWRADSLRGLFGALAAEAGRDLIGQMSTRVSGGGDLNHISGDVTVNLSDRDFVEVSYLRCADADTLMECFVPPRSQRTLTQLVEREGLVFLAGVEGTGRSTAALAALIEWTRSTGHGHAADGVERIGVIHGRGGRGAFPELRPAHAYLLDDTHEEWARDTDHLRDLVAKVESRLVVLVSRRRADSPGPTAEHQPPPATEVFHRRLETAGRVVDIDPRLPGEIVKEISEAIDGESSPRHAVDRAWEIAQGVKEGRSYEALLAELPKRLSEHIRGRLDQSQPIVGRCFMAGVAVLHDLPEFTVSEAALKLADHIYVAWHVKEENRTPPAWEQLDRWLEYAGATVHHSAHASGGRVVRLNRRTAPAATIRVLWEDHPTIREPLIRWLCELGEHPDSAVQIKAAHTVGKLATLDFDTIRARFLTPWTVSRRFGDHRLAALALEAAAQDPAMVFTVHEHLRALAKSGGAGARAVAIQAYGSSVGVNAIGEALQTLRQVSATLAVRRNQDAARSIAYLYSARTASTIVRELVSWVEARSQGWRHTAVLAFTRLAVLDGGTPGRPPLTELNMDDELVSLWLNALTLRIVPTGAERSRLAVPDAWTVLGRWVSRYDEQPTACAVIDEVLGTADARSVLLYLRLWRRRKLISNDLYTHLRRLVKEG